MESLYEGLCAAFRARNSKLLRANVCNALASEVFECILHPLGFYLIRLAACGNATVRLHYWPANHREKGSAITPYHDHVWSLCSCVLAGALENVLLDLDRDELGDFEVADINQFDNVDEVVPASYRVRMRVQSSAKYCTNEFYEIAPRVFHYTNVRPGEAVLTVVQATVAVQGGPRTLLPFGSRGHMPSRQPITGSGEILLEIGELLKKHSF